MGKTIHKAYGKVLSDAIYEASHAVETGNVSEFALSARRVVRFLRRYGKELYGSSFTPGIPAEEREEDDIFLDAQKYPHTVRAAINTALLHYSPKHIHYQKNIIRAKVNEQRQWRQGFSARVGKGLGKPSSLARLQTLKKRLEELSEAGDMGHFEQVAGLIVTTAKVHAETTQKSLNSLKRNPSRYTKEIAFQEKSMVTYEDWQLSYSPGGKRYDLLREFTRQNRYKKGLPPEFP